MQLSREEVRKWLLDYAWMPEPPDVQAAEVSCILSQNDWKYIDALADKFAGAQFEPGPKAYSEGVEFALSALYECHDGPHLIDCPRRQGR